MYVSNFYLKTPFLVLGIFIDVMVSKSMIFKPGIFVFVIVPGIFIDFQTLKWKNIPDSRTGVLR